MKSLKYLILFSLAISLFSSCNNEVAIEKESYKITGEFRGALAGTAFIKTRTENGWETIDSAAFIDGKFTMDGHVEEVDFAYLTSDVFRGGIPLFLENAEYNIELHKDSLNEVKISGSDIQLVYDIAKQKMAEYDASWQDFYYNTYRSMTDDEKAQNEAYLNQIYDSAQIMKKGFIKEYISNNVNSIASAQLLMDNEDALGTDDMVILYETLSQEVLLSKSGVNLTKRVDIVKKTAIGQPLVDFVMSDTAGNPLKLSEISKGKYLLVDFWAAWCGPCRKENPNVVDNYTKYHPHGFDVLGVSFDEKKENWLKAIEEDNLTWTQVSDLKGWDNSAGKLYGIRSIPQNILLSPEGIILEKNLRGEDLGKKLEELFGK